MTSMLESGDWRLESGEWRVESGEWRVDIGYGHKPILSVFRFQDIL